MSMIINMEYVDPDDSYIRIEKIVGGDVTVTVDENDEDDNHVAKIKIPRDVWAQIIGAPGAQPHPLP